MKNVRLVAAVALGSASGALIGYSALAGGDKVAFPENFDKGTLYATVDRYDNKQYRELYATPAAVDAVRKGQPIPSGTVLTLIQYKAQLDAAGEPLKDASGKFQKGDLIAAQPRDPSAVSAVNREPGLHGGDSGAARAQELPDLPADVATDVAVVCHAFTLWAFRRG